MKEIESLKKDDDYKAKKKEEDEKKKKDKKDSLKNIITSEEGKINEFGREQQMTICQFCHNKIYTNVEQEVSWFGIFLCIFLLILLKFYSIILIVLLIPLTQSTIHTCPNCLNRIGVHTFYDSLSLKDKIFSFQFLSFGIIITKKQLLGLFIFIFFLIVLYVIMASLSFQKQILKESWDDFQKICSGDESKCNMIFRYQDISWKGYVIRVNFNENFFSRNRAIFLMKMDPTIQEGTEMVLEVTDTIYNKYKIDIMKISRGDQILFNATITNTVSPVRAEVYFLQLLGNKIHIEPHIHKSGRYTTGEGEVSKGKQLYYELPNVISNENKLIKQNETGH